MSAYYNEIDEFAAQWLRNLIKKGHIADGVVDTRSIKDVHPDDLADFTQCHFFAGIGVWSHSLRTAGWPDDRHAWTGSCPCQPWSAAGKGEGFEDERHLWPDFHRLIRERQPGVVFGEQVASKDGLAWLDAVCADMEASGYAIGAFDICAAGVGAPHIRQRLWFAAERMGHANGPRHERHGLQPLYGERQGREQVGRSSGSVSARGLADTDAGRRAEGRSRSEGLLPHPDGAPCGLGDDDDAGLEGQRGRHQAQERRLGALRPAAEAGEPRGLADAASLGPERHPRAGREAQRGIEHDSHDDEPGSVNGDWRAADWLFCRDGKWRPVEPGTFPLAHGVAGRVGRLRAYGNAIVPQVAAEVIAAFMECRP